MPEIESRTITFESYVRNEQNYDPPGNTLRQWRTFTDAERALAVTIFCVERFGDATLMIRTEFTTGKIIPPPIYVDLIWEMRKGKNCPLILASIARVFKPDIGKAIDDASNKKENGDGGPRDPQ